MLREGELAFTGIRLLIYPIQKSGKNIQLNGVSRLYLYIFHTYAYINITVKIKKKWLSI